MCVGVSFQQIAGLVDGPGYTMTQRVSLLCAIGECCRTKAQFVSLLDEFCNRGGILPIQVASLQTQVRTCPALPM